MQVNGNRRVGSLTPPEGGLPTQWTEKEILMSLLTAVRGTFIRNLGIAKIPIISSNSKAAKWTSDKTIGYPRAYLKFSTWDNLRELANFSTTRRGYVHRIPDGDQTRIYNARVFPILVSGELHILLESPAAATHAISEMGMLSSSRSLGLKVTLADAFDYMSLIQVETSTTLDDADFSSEDKKGQYDVVFPFQVRGWLGRIDKTVVNLRSRVLVQPVVGELNQHANLMLEDPEKFSIGAKNVEPPYPGF